MRGLLLMLAACAPVVDVPFESDVRFVVVLTFDGGEVTAVSRLEEVPYTIHADPDRTIQILAWTEVGLAGEVEVGTELALHGDCAMPLPKPDGAYEVHGLASPQALSPDAVPRLSTPDRLERCPCEELLVDFGLGVYEQETPLADDVRFTSPASSTSVFVSSRFGSAVYEVDRTSVETLPFARYSRTSDGSLWAIRDDAVQRGTSVQDLAPFLVQEAAFDGTFVGSPPWAPVEQSALYVFKRPDLIPLWGVTMGGLVCYGLDPLPEAVWGSPDDFALWTSDWCRIRDGVPATFPADAVVYHPELGLVGAGSQGGMFVVDDETGGQRSLLPPRGPLDHIGGLGLWRGQLIVARHSGEVSIVTAAGDERLLTTLPRRPEGIAPLEDGFAVVTKNETPAGRTTTYVTVYFFEPVECR